MELQLNNRVAIVCAASKGLGKGTALALAQEGVNVVICARNQVTLEATANEIQEKTGAQILPVVCDLGKAEDIQHLVDETLATFSRIDILVTNIAHPKMGGFFTLSEEDWQTGYDNILLPVIRLCRLVAPEMQKNQWGRIVHIASYAIKEPNSTYLVSGLFRTGIAVLSKALANELGRDGIRVNTVCPGLFHTELGDGILQRKAENDGTTFAEAEAEMAAFTATGQLGQVEELAAYISFLCSELANHITGQVLMSEGGKAKGLF